MKIPKYLKIGAFNWEVIQDDNVTHAADVCGQSHFKSQRIFLEKTSTEQNREATFIHELLHVVAEQSGLVARLKNITGITEEEIVSSMENGLYQVLKDNDLLK